MHGEASLVVVRYRPRGFYLSRRTRRTSRRCQRCNQRHPHRARNAARRNLQFGGTVAVCRSPSKRYTANANGLGTLRLLEAICILGLVNRTLFGKVQEIAQKETTPFYPRSPYAAASALEPVGMAFRMLVVEKIVSLRTISD